MTISCPRGLLVVLAAMVFAIPLAARAADASASKKASDPEKYTLRYKFQPGETLRWTVEHRKRVQASLGGATQTTDSVSRSTKCWRVLEVDPQGNAVFEGSVEDIEMRQEMTGQKPVSYSSKRDKTPPAGYEEAARRVGKPLTRIKMDARGETLQRTALLNEPAPPEKPQLTIPLPERAVAVGDSWQDRHTLALRLENGATKSILTQQVFTLKSVKTGVATIEIANQVLTPIHSPELEAKLIERYARGTARFDIDAGHILSLQMDLDHQVVGFRGADSSLHYLTRSTEQFVPPPTAVAARPAEAKAK